MDLEQLRNLSGRGWRFTRDGSTATALLLWEDPDDPGSGWELQVLKSEGHRARFTLEPSESGLTERSPEELEQLTHSLAEARELMQRWQGELPDEDDA